MADKDIQMKQRNATNNAWDNLFPKTKASNVNTGTLPGIVAANNNTSYTTKQIRNIILSTEDPSGGSNGDIWIKYTP